MFCKSCAGAAGSDIYTGTRPVEELDHPQSSEERQFPFHAYRTPVAQLVEHGVALREVVSSTMANIKGLKINEEKVLPL